MAEVKEKKFRISSVIENLTPSGLSDGSPERSEITPIGLFKEDGETFVISYAEETEGGRVLSEITVAKNRVDVKRRGAVVSDMRFEEGVCDKSVYTVSPYSFDSEIVTRKIRNNMTWDGGRLDIFYNMTIGGAAKTVRMKIEVL